MSGPVEAVAARAAGHRARTGRPFVTLSYAQTLDGSLTLRAGQASPISGPESKLMTHRLRAAHDAILIGIGTLLADDPRLTARRAGGPHPQPIVLDSTLRFPRDARLLNGPRHPLIATTGHADAARASALEACGARILRIDAGEDDRIHLAALLDTLGELGINNIMVEGGAEVITSFLRERLADYLVLTIAPVLAGGYRAVGPLGVPAWDRLPRVGGMRAEWAGPDLIVWGGFK
jgi:GTP cyclohydrolase II